MKKRWMILVLVLFQFSLFSASIQGAESLTIFEKIEKLKSHVHHENWDEAMVINDDLKGWYTKNKWKLQLLGDESEYEEVEHDISKLKSALEEKDKSESKIMIENLKTTLKQIESF